VKCHLKLHIDITLHYITLHWLGRTEICRISSLKISRACSNQIISGSIGRALCQCNQSVQSRGSVADRETARSIRSYTALSGQTTLRAVSATERVTHTAQLSRPLSDMFKNRVINNSRTTSIVSVLLPAKRDIQYNLIHPGAASVHQRQRWV